MKIMRRIMQQFVVIGLFLFVIGGMSMAQEAVGTLRDYAEKIGFYIGAAVYTPDFVDMRHQAILYREFNMMTPENEAKFCQVQPRQGEFNFQPLDTLVNLAEEHGMTIRGHTLVWHQCVPDWLTNGRFTRTEAIELLRQHIHTVVGRYKGRIAMWDVINEGIAENGVGLRDTIWYQLIGSEYIRLAFEFAHEADPDALLFYNDYSIEELNAKSDGVYALAQDLLQRGVPLHGIGFQGHFTLGQIKPREIAENMQRLGELGLQVQFTEVDIRFDGAPTDVIARQQANDYRTLITVCLDSDYCNAFVTWGVVDQFSWLRGANLGFFNNPSVTPLLFDDNFQPKPAYFAVLQALEQRASQVDGQ